MQEIRNKRNIGILFAVLGGISWGFSACFGQYLYANAPVDTNWVISIRLTIAGLIFVLISMAKDYKNTFAVFKSAKDVKDLIIFGITGMFLSQYAFYTTIEFANAGTAAVMQSLAAVMILIYMSVKSRKLPRLKQMLAIFICLFGVFLLSTGGDFSSMKISGIVLVSGLFSALGGACYNILSGDLIKRYGLYAVAGFGMLISGLLFMPIARPWETVVPITAELIFGMFGVVVVGTAVAFGFFLKGVSIIGPLMGSLIGTLEPVSAVLIAALVLKSDFSAVDFVAFALIIGAVLWLCTQEKDKNTIEI